ncbi:MAG: hypothetical protein KDA20_09315 [Phycisphaerales bacterium]|nr:hypothetical protein [Phycisphaerales bacterium]
MSAFTHHSSDDDAQANALGHAQSLFASYREGLLLLDRDHTPIRFVTEHASGKLIAPVPAKTFESVHPVVFIPEETDTALQMLVTPEEIKESATTDRWMAFHLSDASHPDHTHWAAFEIDSAKHGPWVFDGDPFMAPNPAAELEPRVCKRLNADPEVLAKLTMLLTNVTSAEGARCVGVDPKGLYIRLRHGVIRAPFPKPDEHAPPAIETLDSIIDTLLARVG